MRQAIHAARRSGRAILLLSLAACVLAGCASAGSAQAPTPTATARPAEEDRLYVSGADRDDNGATFVLDAASGAVRHKVPVGYISPDWSALYEVTLTSDSTTVRAYDLATGHELRETTVAGLYDVPVPPDNPRESAFSPDGRHLLLFAQPTPAEQLAWNQAGKAPPTRIMVLDTSFKAPPRRIDLEGNFWFDTLGTDSLYLIEVLDKSLVYGPGHSPTYHVRRYDLAAGRLDDYPVVDKREPGPMNGNRAASVPSEDGVWLYSLYTREGAGPFIHVLNLKERFAVCVDLPFSATGDGFETGLMWSLALSPDARTLYAVNGLLGQVAAVDAQSFAVRSATLPEAAARAPGLLARIGSLLIPTAEAKRLLHGGAAVSPDGQTLFAVEGEGFAAIATGDLTLQGRYMAGWPLSSLALSPDGAALYAVSAESRTLLRLALPLAKDAPEPERIKTEIRPAAVMRVAGSAAIHE